MVVLHVLGQCLLRTSYGTITPNTRVLFQLALQCVVERGRHLSRDRVASWLWPDDAILKTPPHDPERLHKRLGCAVSRLRQLDVPIVGDGRVDPHLWIERHDAQIDDEWLANATGHELLHHDLRILPDYVPDGPPELHAWLRDFRSQAQRRVVNVLLHNAQHADEQGEQSPAAALEQRAAEYVSTNGNTTSTSAPDTPIAHPD